jgi:hypothetical protein
MDTTYSHHLGAGAEEGEFWDGFLVQLGVVEGVNATEGRLAHFFLGDAWVGRGGEGGGRKGGI